MAKNKNYEYVLPEGFVLRGGENDYVIEKVLGKGGFGVTYKVKTRVQYKNIRIDAFFAVKEYFPDICSRQSDNATIKIPETKQKEIVDGKKDFINEGLKLQQVCKLNPNIVNVNEVFEANDTAYYVLEYLDGGDLRKLVQDNGTPLTEKQMLDVMLPVGYALQCLHDNRMLHLDVKPDNIVMRVDNRDNSMEPALIDFGIAIHFNNDGTPTSKTPSQGISPGYSPIEQYAQINSFDPRIDVYAYCATCYYLLTGKDPIVSMEMTPDFVRSGLPQGISSHVVDAIEHGMSMNKNIRTSTIEEVLRGLENLEAPELPEIPPKDDVLRGLENIEAPELPEIPPKEEPEELPNKSEKDTVKLGVLSQPKLAVPNDPKPEPKPKEIADPNATKLASGGNGLAENDKGVSSLQKLLISLAAVLIASAVGFLLCGHRIFDSPEGEILAFFAMLAVSGYVGFILNILSNSAEYKKVSFIRYSKYILLGVVTVTCVLFIIGCFITYYTRYNYDTIGFYLIEIFAIICTGGIVFLMIKKFGNDGNYNPDYYIRLLKITVIALGAISAICFLYWAFDYF